jgi:hypothetical protein
VVPPGVRGHHLYDHPERATVTAEDEMRETAKVPETRAMPAIRESETTLSAGSALPERMSSERLVAS